MKLPPPGDFLREALIVLGGAILAAAVVGQIPPLRDWMRRQWDGVPRP